MSLDMFKLKVSELKMLNLIVFDVFAPEIVELKEAELKAFDLES